MTGGPANHGLGTRLRDAMRTPPMRFQVRGVRFVEAHGGTCLLGDSMGLGKSYQTIAYLKLHPEIRPAVVVCPATIKYNWQLEFEKHAGMPSYVAEGRKPFKLDGDIWIINYDILPQWAEWFIKRGVRILVIDECQKISNQKAKRTIAVRHLGKKCEQVLGLSGTPISNGPVEFFPVLNLIAPRVFPAFLPYAFRYCHPRRGFAGTWDFRGASNTAELHEKIKPFMLRRTKEEVLPDLPPMTQTVIPIKCDLREYNRAKTEFIAWLRATKGAEAVKRAKGAETLVRLGQLRQLAAAAKLPVVVEWLHDWLADRDEKLVVFGIHKPVMRKLRDTFPNAAVIVGETGMNERADAIRRFQTDPACRLFLGNLKAAGVGTTLTAAPATAHVEFSWVPNDHDQARDRVNRIGQTAKHLDAFYFVAKGTIEEYLMELLDAKRNVISQVVDGKEISAHGRIIEKLLESGA